MPIEGAVRHESISVSSAAVGLTTLTPGDGVLPVSAMITVEGAQIRFCFDGTAATASVGHLADVGDVITLQQRDFLTQFSAIRAGGTDATLRVTYGVGYVP